jgi:hypothetical protein
MNFALPRRDGRLIFPAQPESAYVGKPNAALASCLARKHQLRDVLIALPADHGANPIGHVADRVDRLSLQVREAAKALSRNAMQGTYSRFFIFH